jgi:hypothetical protein
LVCRRLGMGAVEVVYWTIVYRELGVSQERLIEAKGYTKERILEILANANPQWEIINLQEGGTPPKPKQEEI